MPQKKSIAPLWKRGSDRHLRVRLLSAEVGTRQGSSENPLMGATSPHPFFPDRKTKGFRDWIKLQTFMEFKPNEEVVEVGDRVVAFPFLHRVYAVLPILQCYPRIEHMQMLGLVASEIVADITILAKKVQNDALPRGEPACLPPSGLCSQDGAGGGVHAPLFNLPSTLCYQGKAKGRKPQPLQSTVVAEAWRRLHWDRNPFNVLEVAAVVHSRADTGLASDKSLLTAVLNTSPSPPIPARPPLFLRSRRGLLNM
jgi:hypothetical protein